MANDQAPPQIKTPRLKKKGIKNGESIKLNVRIKSFFRISGELYVGRRGVRERKKFQLVYRYRLPNSSERACFRVEVIRS